jgi:hypothetical protein
MAELQQLHLGTSLLQGAIMSRVDEINAQIAKLEAERESAMFEDKANVLAKMKADIKLYDFKATDFKGLLKSRVTQKQVEEFLKKKDSVPAKKAAAKKTTK